jgi:hypothetical protein
MPFTFKLSQRLARIRRQGPVAQTVAPVTVGVFTPCRLVVATNLLTREWNQIADPIFVGALSSSSTVVPVGGYRRNHCNALTNNWLRDCGTPARLVPSGRPGTS